MKTASEKIEGTQQEAREEGTQRHDTSPLTKHSAVLADRIAEAASRIQELEAALAALPAQKAALLGAPVLDETALATLERLHEKHTDDIANLRARIKLLEQQREQALAHEAETRRLDIVAEATQLLVTQSAARAQFDETIDTLLATARTLATLRENHKKLICEDRYLRDRFALDARAEPPAFNVPPLPSKSTLELRVFDKLTGLFDVAGRWHNEWELKRRELSERREKQRREAEAMQPRTTPGRGPLLHQTFSRDKSDANATSDPVAGDGATTSERQSKHELLHAVREEEPSLLGLLRG